MLYLGWSPAQRLRLLRMSAGETPETANGCIRCGSTIDADGWCEDVTCPFNDCRQTDPRGFAGFPDVDPHPDSDGYIIKPSDAEAVFPGVKWAYSPKRGD